MQIHEIMRALKTRIKLICSMHDTVWLYKCPSLSPGQSFIVCPLQNSARVKPILHISTSCTTYYWVYYVHAWTYLKEVSQHAVVQGQQHQSNFEIDIVILLELGVLPEPSPPGGWSQGEVEISRKEKHQTEHKPIWEREREREMQITLCHCITVNFQQLLTVS